MSENQMLSSIQPFRAALGAAPVLFDTTWPSLKMKSDGMPRTPMAAAVLGLVSTSTLAILMESPYSAASSSSAGPICLQGPHHSAQKSTTTGTLEFLTSASKVSSVTATVDIWVLLAAGRMFGSDREIRYPLPGRQGGAPSRELVSRPFPTTACRSTCGSRGCRSRSLDPDIFEPASHDRLPSAAAGPRAHCLRCRARCGWS